MLANDPTMVVMGLVLLWAIKQIVDYSTDPETGPSLVGQVVMIAGGILLTLLAAFVFAEVVLSSASGQ
ncbi:hypothetical protein LCGC14_0443600 [marine sediment metagenome]|uniref:Uncharacterized protein n=1 Tax=marine sediment metagenome TaxID=412755 RepID=A0A0F9SQI3_9ZZZZ